MSIIKRKEHYQEILREFYKSAQSMNKEQMSKILEDLKESERKTALVIEQTKQGMAVAKKAFEDLQKREQQRLEEKVLSQQYMQTKIKILDLLVNKRKIPEELKKSLEG